MQLTFYLFIIRLRLLEHNNLTFNKNNAKTATEQDFVSEIRLPIMIAMLTEIVT